MAQYKVGILMGSPNDMAKMQPAADILEGFDVEVDMRVISAHRNPNAVTEFATNARDAGFSAIICGAGMAAALPGCVAAHTTLPVVGVPLSASALNGVDALYSIVQMPPGVPVASVAIDGAKNAALLVAQIIAVTDGVMEDKVAADRAARASA